MSNAGFCWASTRFAWIAGSILLPLAVACGTGEVSANGADAAPTADAQIDAAMNPLMNLWFVGDSILVGAEPRVRELYDGSHNLEFRGQVGDSIGGRQPHIADASAATPDAVVIQAGINNVGGGFINVDALQSDIATAMDTVSNVPCVVWATYLSAYPSGSYTVLGQPKAELGGLSVSQKLNELIRDEAAKRHNVHVADFQVLVDANVAAWVAGDGLHLSSVGYENLARLYRDTLEQSCR